MKPNGDLAGYRMLLSFAHPDDESFGMGGAIAYYAERGVEITLICSTNGDVGTVAPEYLEQYNSIAELRLAELRCAAEKLGIKNVITYGFRDSGMAGAPENEHPDCLVQADEEAVTARVVQDLRTLRPHVVVTFDPYGGYGHPDHIFMHRVTTRAFYAAGDSARFREQLAEGHAAYQPAKLYYTSFPRLPLRVMLWAARLRGEDPRRMGTNRDLDMQAALDNQLPTTTRLRVGEYEDVWSEASNCHASQQSPRQMQGLASRFARFIYNHQEFTRVYPPRNGKRERLERDLFAGVTRG